MADNCTYADLRFPKPPLPLKKGGTAGPDPEASLGIYVNAGECTYGNAAKSEVGSHDGVNSKFTWREQDNLWGRTSCCKRMTYILAAILLVTLVTSTGLGVRLFQVLEDFEAMKSNSLQESQRMNNTLEHTETRAMETELKLEESNHELEKIREKMNSLNISWHLNEMAMEENKQHLAECNKKDTETQRRISTLESFLKEFCQRDWKLLAGSCLYISNNSKTRYKSQEECTSKGAWLIGSKVQVPEVKKFMNNVQINEYWVGLRTTDWNNDNWKDPSQTNLDLYTYGTCGMTQWGQLKQKSCYSKDEKKFICEKGPLKITLINGIPDVI